MKPRSGKAFRYLLTVLLTVVLLYLSFRGADPEALLAAITAADFGWLLLMFLLLMISHSLRALRWRYLLDPIKPGIGFRNLFSGVMVGYFVNNILPRAGELVRPYTLGKLERISRSSVLGTIVVERLIDGVSFLLLLVMIPLIYNGPLSETFPWLESAGIILTVSMTAGLLLIVFLMGRRDLTTRLVGAVAPFFPRRWRDSIIRAVHSFLDGFLIVRHPKNVLLLLLLSFGIWFFYVAMTKAALNAFHLEGSLGWRAATVVLAISSIGIAIPTPGSTGGYHFFTSQTLTHLFSVPEEIALGFATLTHGVGYIGITIIGLYFVLQDHVHLSEAGDDSGGEG